LSSAKTEDTKRVNQCFEINLTNQVPLVFLCGWKLKCDPRIDPIICTVDNITLSHGRLDEHPIPIEEVIYVVQQVKSSGIVYVNDFHTTLKESSALIFSCFKISDHLYISLTSSSILNYYFGTRRTGGVDEFKKCSLSEIEKGHRNLNLQVVGPNQLHYDSYVTGNRIGETKNENIQVESGIHPSFYDGYYRGLNLPKENEHVLTIFPTFRVFYQGSLANTFFSMQGIPQNSGQILFVLLEIEYYLQGCEIESSEISHVSLNLPGNPILFSAHPGKWAFFAWISTNDADGPEKLHFCSLHHEMFTRLPELQQHITSLVDKPGPEKIT